MNTQQLKNRLHEPVRDTLFRSGYDATGEADEAADIACDVIFSDPLVAAAPELLATCKAILGQKPRISLTDAECEAERRRWAAMRAAVAEAQGGGA